MKVKCHRFDFVRGILAMEGYVVDGNMEMLYYELLLHFKGEINGVVTGEDKCFISEVTGMSVGSVSNNLVRLCKVGLLERLGGGEYKLKGPLCGMQFTTDIEFEIVFDGK